MYTVLQANIVAKIQELLPAYSLLPYGIDLSENKKTKGKGFSVLLDDSTTSNGVVGTLTVFTNIQIKLLDSYGSERNGDNERQALANQLADTLIALFKDLAQAKLNTAGVRNVTMKDLSNATYVDGEKTVFRTLTIEANLKV